MADTEKTVRILVEPIAGYRLDALLGWEYVPPDEQIRAAVDWFDHDEHTEHEDEGS
jgi:hypothetical protein